MASRSSVMTAAALAALALAGCGSSSPAAAPSISEHPSTSAPATDAILQPRIPTRTTTVPAITTSVAPSATTAKPTTRPTSSRPETSTAEPSPSKTAARRLPLDLTTGDAEQVVTVVTSGGGDTTATVQRWTKDGSAWRKVGPAIDGYVGSSGVGTAHEGSRKTPKGSFTLTSAFGSRSDPGTRLPYLRTTPDDYWISSPGPKYNTRQRCGDCGYKNGVNERIYYPHPEYEHAVVIDYNTANAPGGVKAGKGSAFFLHVSAGKPTAGCVAVPYDDLSTVMRWLRPAEHPRILIGTD